MKSHKYYVGGLLTTGGVTLGPPNGSENAITAAGQGCIIFSAINNIPEGATLYNRSTKKIYVNSIEINAYINAQGATPSPAWGGMVRVLVYVNHLGAGQVSSRSAGFTYGELFQSQINQANITDLYKKENRHSYTILADRVYDLKTLGYTYNSTATVAQQVQQPAHVRLTVPVRRYIRYLQQPFVSAGNFALSGVTSAAAAGEIMTTGAASGAGTRNFVEEDICILFVADPIGWSATVGPVLSSFTFRTNFQDF